MEDISCSDTQDTVKEIFANYMKQKGHRKTPERFAILAEIYEHNEHFDVETLFVFMKNKNYQVSRATIYNTVDLLLGCGLVVKHQFGKNIAQYEKAFECSQHDHLICQSCGRVAEFCDPRVQQIQTTVGELMEFKINYHSLYFYGICKKCQDS